MPPPRLAERLAAGFRLHEAGRLAEAAEQARKLLKQAPELAGAHYLAGLVALDRGKPAQAAKHFATAARLGPESAALHQARGVAELRSFGIAQAVVSLRAAATLAPGHAPTLLLLAEAHLAAGDDIAALAAIDQVLALGADADAFDMRGTILRRQGRLGDAIAAFEGALAARPNFVAALSNLGGSLIETGAPERAIPLLRQALELDKDQLSAARNLGLALEATGAVEDAAALFGALAQSGDDEAQLALGQLDLRRGRAGDAARSFAGAVARQPNSVRAHYGLGEARRMAGDAAAAADHYRACLRLDPTDAVGAGLVLALVTGEAAPASPPPEFVRALFDAYAGRFDRSLTEQLGYRAPALLRAALDPLIADLPPLALLDLGCGTGLAASSFAERAATIDGIDLSPRMIDLARARGLYRTLVTADLLAGIAGLPRRVYDLVLAADVLVYVGNLAPLMASVASALKPGGLFAFTVEHLPDDRGDYALQPSRRYAHARRYIESLAAPGFATARLDPVSTRTDRGEPVPGLLVIMRRNLDQGERA